MRVPVPNAEIPSDYIKTGPPPLRHNSSWIWRWMTRMEKPNSDGTDPIYYKCRIVGCNWGMKKTVCCSPIKAETHLKLAHRLTQSVLASNLALTPLDNTMIHNYNNPLNIPNELPAVQNPPVSMAINPNGPSQELPPTRANPGLPYGASVLLPQHQHLPQHGGFIPNHQYYQPYPLYQPQHGGGGGSGVGYDSQRQLPTYPSDQQYQSNPHIPLHTSEQQYQSQMPYMGLPHYPFYLSQQPNMPNASYKSEAIKPEVIIPKIEPNTEPSTFNIDSNFEQNTELQKKEENAVKKTEVQLWLEDCELENYVDFFQASETDFLSDLRCYSNLESEEIAKKLHLNDVMKEEDIIKFYEELRRLDDEKVEQYRIKVANQRSKKRRL